MEHITMLDKPNLASSIRQIFEASNDSKVKKMIREFTIVYTRTLSLFVSGNLAPAKCEVYFSIIRDVANYFMDMLPSAENEGIVVQLVRFIDAMLMAHNSSDLSSHQHIVEMADVMLKKCIKVLFQLVTEPHVGGSSLCLAVSVLYKVAHFKADLRLTVTDVAEALINSSPPNLFVHNIKSFHKTLQRNFWRLIKITEEASFKERLINLTIRVGVPKRRVEKLVQHVPKKRSIHDTDNVTTEGHASNAPYKRQKVTERDIINLSNPLMLKNWSPPHLRHSASSSSDSKGVDNVAKTNGQVSRISQRKCKINDTKIISLSCPLMLNNLSLVKFSDYGQSKVECYNGHFSKGSKLNLNAVKQRGNIYKLSAYSKSLEHSCRGTRLCQVPRLPTSATHPSGTKLSKLHEAVLDRESSVKSFKQTSLSEKWPSQAVTKTITKEGLTNAPAAAGNLYATSSSSTNKQQRSTEENTGNLCSSIVSKDQLPPIIINPTLSHTTDKSQCVDQKQKNAQLSDFWLNRHSYSPRHGSMSKPQRMNETPRKSRSSGYWLCGTSVTPQYRPRRLEYRIAEYHRNLCCLG